jgi:hypothetical protein
MLARVSRSLTDRPTAVITQEQGTEVSYCHELVMRLGEPKRREISLVGIHYQKTTVEELGENCICAAVL